MEPANPPASFWARAGLVLLDAGLLAVVTAVNIAIFRGGTTGTVLQVALLAAYAALFRKKRTILGLLAAVVLAHLLLGTAWVIWMRRPPTPASALPTPATVAMVRSALAEYKATNKGVYPSRLEDLTPRYLIRVPELQLGPHAASSKVEAYGSEVCAPGGPDPAKIHDMGGWGYVSDPKAPCWGGVFLDCSHKDPEGRSFDSY